MGNQEKNQLLGEAQTVGDTAAPLRGWEKSCWRGSRIKAKSLSPAIEKFCQFFWGFDLELCAREF
jgi:hypothetical protein